MSIEIIREANYGTTICHVLHFDYEGERGWGFSFDCDSSGNIDESKLNPCALKNLHACRAGQVDGRKVGAGRIETFDSPWKTPRIGRCECGEEVVLDRFTNTCHGCNRDYNTAGQELAPREFWGEETGESLADILAIDGASVDELLEGD